jgi:hypothetical protein
MSEERRAKSASAGMYLSMELGNSLSIQTEGMEDCFESVLVGLEPPAYLIVQMPLISDADRHFRQGNCVVVRYSCLGNAYEFPSQVLGSIVKPFRLIFLSCPEEVDNLRLRKNPRLCCYIPAVAAFEGREVKGVISDISPDGCKFNIKVPPGLQPLRVHVVDNIRLSFTLLGVEGVQHFQGKVRNTSQDRKRIALGIELENVDEDIVEQISAYIEGEE